MCVKLFMLQQQHNVNSLFPEIFLSLINGTHHSSLRPSSKLREDSEQILIVEYDESVTQSKLNLKLVRKVLTFSWRNMKRNGNISSNIPNEIT